MGPIARTMRLGIDGGVFPGGVVLVRHRNEIVFHEAYGHSVTHQDAHTVSAHPVRTRRETVYDLASITKLFTATCVMRLVDEEHIRLDDPVASHLPGFAVNGKADVTVRQLLAHVAGLPYERLWETAPTPEARRQRVLAIKPEGPAGTSYVYHDTNFIVLGMLIEQVDGHPLDRAIAARILRPLGLDQTGYGPPGASTPGVAATEDESYVGRGMVWGEAHDENAWSLGGVAGHAGLFGSARDLSIFGQAYLNGGAFGAFMLLKPDTVAEMTRNQIGRLGSRGLGWQLNAPHYMGSLASPETYGHTGFTGTSIVVDPRRDLVVVLLTNRVHPTRHGRDVNPTRQAVANAVLAAADAA
ncbi:MAG: beta-lactamase family protein [Chloroflexota bacterium]|nr:beta-lactamase family protein [Chloroflexota bacterium]